METSIVISDFVDARVTPKGSLENLSQAEVAKLLDSGRGGTYELFRKCALAVLNSGSEIDSAKDVFERYRDFDIRIEHQTWGIKLVLRNAPATAFVDGEMIQGIKEHLFAVLRDVIYIGSEIIDSGRFDLKDPAEHHQRRVSHPAQRAHPAIARRAQPRSCAGAGTRSAARNTTTPRRSATSLACEGSTSAPGAGRAR